jgi:5'-phosphate synthase pdxT subunit
MSLRVAVLALLGDFEKHILRLRELGSDTIAARTSEEFENADAVIIPGGESTTITKLMSRYGIDLAIKNASGSGKPIYGTCAGMIVMAKSLVSESAEKSGQTTLRLMDITVNRNAYGRQIESFETTLDDSKLILNGKPIKSLEAVFIRAPAIVELGSDVNVLASYDGSPVLIEQGNLLASSFHPEMTSDTSIHQYFLSMIERSMSTRGNN